MLSYSTAWRAVNIPQHPVVSGHSSGAAIDYTFSAGLSSLCCRISAASPSSASNSAADASGTSCEAADSTTAITAEASETCSIIDDVSNAQLVAHNLSVWKFYCVKEVGSGVMGDHTKVGH